MGELQPEGSGFLKHDQMSLLFVRDLMIKILFTCHLKHKCYKICCCAQGKAL